MLLFVHKDIVSRRNFKQNVSFLFTPFFRITGIFLYFSARCIGKINGCRAIPHPPTKNPQFPMSLLRLRCVFHDASVMIRLDYWLMFSGKTFFTASR